MEECGGGLLLWFNPGYENQGVCSPPPEGVLLFRDPAVVKLAV